MSVSQAVSSLELEYNNYVEITSLFRWLRTPRDWATVILTMLFPRLLAGLRCNKERVKASRKHRVETLSERMTRKVSESLRSSFRTAIRLRPVRRTHPPHPVSFSSGSVMSSGPHQLTHHPPCNLASDTWTPHPRSRSTSCFHPFSMQATTYLLIYYHAQELTRPAKKVARNVEYVACQCAGSTVIDNW